MKVYSGLEFRKSLILDAELNPLDIKGEKEDISGRNVKVTWSTDKLLYRFR
jgi:hypothetical protein